MTKFLPDERPYVIAEVGGNHGGDYNKALNYVEAAATAGVDAVKFQIYRAERLIRPDEPPLPLAGDKHDTQFDRFKQLEFTREEWEGLVSAVNEYDMHFSASIFDPNLVDFVSEVSPFIKIASGDLTNVPLLRQVRKLGDPIILSTGFATIEEIDQAIKELPTDRLVLLHCVGSYPTADADANLQMIERLEERFDVPIGYSDHTVGTLAPIVAMSKGAAVIEKHFTLDKSIKTGDHRLSADPKEMSQIVNTAHRIGELEKKNNRNTAFECECGIKTDMRRSLATATEIKSGDAFNHSNLTALRPETGVSPLRYDEVLGSAATRDLESGTLLDETDFE